MSINKIIISVKIIVKFFIDQLKSNLITNY